ncbi:MAG: SCO family protein [Elusimicrobia bacterium]|nr:SCO family protein [Elusimicrobiota bacterium]
MGGLFPILFLAVWTWAAEPQVVDEGSVGVKEQLGGQAALDPVFSDEDGKPVSLRSLVDRPTVLTLNYFACAGICTPLLHGLTQALNAVPREPGRDFRVITVSFDERDTPAIAKEKRRNYLKQLKRPFPPEAWRFITGKNPAIKTLTGSVGFEYQAWGKEYLHPGVVVLLSPQGVVTRYMYGTTFLPADLAMAVDEAKKGLVRPTIIKTLQYCFSGDPRGRKYVVGAMKVMGTTVLLSALGLVAWLVWGARRPA